jgi:hypothetical protein
MEFKSFCIDEECYEMMELLIKRMEEKQGVTEQMKAENQMMWQHTSRLIQTHISFYLAKVATLTFLCVKSKRFSRYWLPLHFSFHLYANA